MSCARKVFPLNGEQSREPGQKKSFSPRSLLDHETFSISAISKCEDGWSAEGRDFVIVGEGKVTSKIVPSTHRVALSSPLILPSGQLQPLIFSFSLPLPSQQSPFPRPIRDHLSLSLPHPLPILLAAIASLTGCILRPSSLGAFLFPSVVP